MAQVKIAELQLPWTVASAGLAAADGLPMSAHSAQALTRRQIPFALHESRFLRQDMVDAADLVLCMTSAHADEVRRRFPEAADKVRCIGHQEDIADPFGGSDEAYEQAARDIETALDTLFTELMQ